MARSSAVNPAINRIIVSASHCQHLWHLWEGEEAEEAEEAEEEVEDIEGIAIDCGFRSNPHPLPAPLPPPTWTGAQLIVQQWRQHLTGDTINAGLNPSMFQLNDV